MKNKQSGDFKYISAKNVRRSGNCLIHRWISMQVGDICAATADAMGGLRRRLCSETV
ncbi:MAG: hypothetical protein P1P72_09630 [ANME-2 cluster archaeon]|nr:hypothetical protein [ANME-2 cluster archaeon]